MTLEINIMVHVKVNRELASLEANLTSTDMSWGYINEVNQKLSQQCMRQKQIMCYDHRP